MKNVGTIRFDVKENGTVEATITESLEDINYNLLCLLLGVNKIVAADPFAFMQVGHASMAIINNALDNADNSKEITLNEATEVVGNA